MRMKRPSRILLLIPHLGGGGAEQVTALLARGLSPDRYELHLGLITQREASSESLPPWVQVHGLGASRVRAGAWRILCLIRRLRPDLILSGMAHLNFMVLLLRPFYPPGTRVVVRQNGTVSAQLASRDLPSYSRLLYRLLYRRANRVICQTQAMRQDLSAELGIAKSRLAVLPNPVDVDAIRTAVRRSDHSEALPGSILHEPHLLAVGRLSQEKGFDLLLRAFAQVRERFPHANLTIVGSGPLEGVLRTLASDLKIEGAVCFAGRVTDPAAYFSQATLFVLSSRHEGMPNALLEAAAGGLPLVALPSSQGLVDLLHGQPGVWLADEITAEALAASLLAALHRLQPGERFAHSWVEEFRFERAIEAYEDLIDAVLEEKWH
jgi:glycosyltransferase involved in cell wall biosynthesis